jgi:hypothetical protein
LNPETGWPHSFLELGTRVHLGIWEHASRRALAFGRYAAALTSMHFTGLYETYHDYSRDAADEARDAQALVARETRFQATMLNTLLNDPVMAPHVSPDRIDRNRRLVALWDGMSLALCHGLSQPRAFRGVPAANGDVELTMEPDGDQVVVRPWPFSANRVVVRAEGRLLYDTFQSAEDLRAALDAAVWTTIEIALKR